MLDGLQSLENIDFATLFRILGIGFGVFWVVVVGWAIFDAFERFNSLWLRILSVLLVVCLPLFGLLIYLIIRPRETVDELKMIDLERRFLKFEAAGLENCSSCGYELMPNFVYCPRCGNELRTKCESCGVYLEPTWRSCPFCGKDQKVATVGREEISVESSSVTESVKKSRKTGRSGRKATKDILLEADGFVRFVGGLPIRAVRLVRSSRGSKRKASNKDDKK